MDRGANGRKPLSVATPTMPWRPSGIVKSTPAGGLAPSAYASGVARLAPPLRPVAHIPPPSPPLFPATLRPGAVPPPPASAIPSTARTGGPARAGSVDDDTLVNLRPVDDVDDEPTCRVPDFAQALARSIPEFERALETEVPPPESGIQLLSDPDIEVIGQVDPPSPPSPPPLSSTSPASRAPLLLIEEPASEVVVPLRRNLTRSRIARTAALGIVAVASILVVFLMGVKPPPVTARIARAAVTFNVHHIGTSEVFDVDDSRAVVAVVAPVQAKPRPTVAAPARTHARSKARRGGIIRSLPF